MTSAGLNWELCRSFLAVLREGNLSRAARSLQLTQPTLGRHVDEMEAALGVALFTRSPQGLTPTDAAFELRPHAEAMATAADALVRAASASSSEDRGTVRITAPRILGAELLPDILTVFRRQHPSIDIELALTNVTENLLQREADIALRMVRPEQAALVAKKIGDVRFGLYASRDYIARHGAPRAMHELLTHTLIGFDKGAAAIKALREIPNPLSRAAFALRSDSPTAQVACVRAGFGIGRLPDLVARRDKTLVPVLADQFSVPVELWAAMHKDARGSRRIRLMFDHLTKSFGALFPMAAKRKPKAG